MPAAFSILLWAAANSSEFHVSAKKAMFFTKESLISTIITPNHHQQCLGEKKTLIFNQLKEHQHYANPECNIGILHHIMQISLNSR